MQTRRRKKKAGKPAEVTATGEPPAATASGEPPAQTQPTAAPPVRPGSKTPAQLPVAWGNVVQDTFNIKDPAKTARRLRAELELGEYHRTQYGSVLEALDRSAGNFEMAGRLARAAKLEEQSFTQHMAVRIEAMRSAAQRELQEEYRAKQRKSPTIQDVEDRMVQSWPDEYTQIKQRIAELHGAVRSLESLRDAWASRCADVRIMADKARPVR